MEALLIHGWDPELYSSKLEGHIDSSAGWKKRSEFVNLLSKSYSIRYYNLPGFCDREAPSSIIDVEFATSDLDSYLKRTKKPKLIIGYSFGGVIALNHKVQMNNDIPTILIAPALSRKYSLFSRVGSLARKYIPDNLQDELKHAYQLLFSKYYRSADNIMRKSYDKIVRLNTSNLIDKSNGENILFIYGDKDTATPWTNVSTKIINNQFDYVLIKNGTHNIGQSHPKEIVKAICSFMKEKEHDNL